MRKGFGLGGEIGAVAGHRSFGYLAVSGYYHFLSGHAPLRLDPYITAGAGSSFEILGGAAPVIAPGAGVNYWFHRHLGLRLEVRDMIFPRACSGPGSIGAFAPDSLFTESVYSTALIEVWQAQPAAGQAATEE